MFNYTEVLQDAKRNFCSLGKSDVYLHRNQTTDWSRCFQKPKVVSITTYRPLSVSEMCSASTALISFSLICRQSHRHSGLKALLYLQK